MSGAIMGRHVAVFDLDQHVAISVDQNGAEGMIAVGQGAARDFERPAQKMLVEFGRTHIRNAVHGCSCRLVNHAERTCDRQGCGSVDELNHDPASRALWFETRGAAALLTMRV